MGQGPPSPYLISGLGPFFSIIRGAQILDLVWTMPSCPLLPTNPFPLK